MNIKAKLTSIVLTGITSITLFNNTSNFTYKYEIIAHSNNVYDVLYMYNVKEETIKIYENVVLDVAEKYHQKVVVDNLNKFKTSDNMSVHYDQGKIVITIDEGKGMRIAGDLRKNYCDKDVINNKYFILDWFFGL